MLKGFREFITETTLSRVFKHFESDLPVTIITAFRGDYNYEENVKRNKQLASKIRKAGYGYVFVDGHWVEKNGNNSDDTSEDSILVIGNEDDNGKLKGLVKKWIKEYDQDAAVFKDENTKNVSLMYQNGSLEDLGTFKPNKIAQAYTKLRGRAGATFVFESASYTKNWIGKLAENN